MDRKKEKRKITREEKAGVSPCVQAQPGLHSELKAGPGYVMRGCPNNCKVKTERAQN